ncbi:MAG: hypothetical protein GY707_05575 [Desulfobacteraceae bacterium]|nr:hypothetical protein [Desulfobacteraceae bacterium]
MNCWCITDDLELIKGDKESIEALRVIYELKFQKMFNIFEQLIQEKKL